MDYSIMLYFNNFSSYRIATYISMLEGYSNNSYMIDSKIPPHITIGMWNSDDNFLKEIKKLAKKTKPFEIVFASLGLFNNKDEKEHLFLAPVKNSSLTDFHNNFYSTISPNKDCEFDRFYKNNDIWVPHVTIGYKIERENINRVVEKCTAIELPQKAVVSKIAVAHCCPFREIEVIELKP